MTPFQTLTARLLRSVSLSEFTKHLEFEVKGITHFGFVPGQWISVKANNGRRRNHPRLLHRLAA